MSRRTLTYIVLGGSYVVAVALVLVGIGWQHDSLSDAKDDRCSVAFAQAEVLAVQVGILAQDTDDINTLSALGSAVADLGIALEDTCGPRPGP